MKVIEAIPYNNFKQKIRIVKENLGKGKIEIHNNIVYIERYEGDSYEYGD